MQLHEYGVEYRQDHPNARPQIKILTTPEAADRKADKLRSSGLIILGRHIREVGHWLAYAWALGEELTIRDELPTDGHYRYAVRYRRAGRPASDTKCRYFESVDAASAFMERLSTGTSWNGLPEFDDLRIDRRTVGPWQPLF